MTIRIAVGAWVLASAIIVGAWAWLGAPVAMPSASSAPGDKLYCLSYTPFHGAQSPLNVGTQVSARQIDEDLTILKQVTDCVRTYSNDSGIDQVPAIARRHGMQVIQGIWLSGDAVGNRKQIDTAVALAKQYPDVIRALVVGNEVLLRGEMSAIDLAATIRAVKARVSVPVTYADVWEYWLRNRDLASAVDFVTIHILPYWEDFPVSAEQAAAHVDAIRSRVAAAFPGKDVLIGETGWPSHGRMRDGALPSPANQARVVQSIVAQARREGYRVNVIEAFDQPWKRALEGTVGGYWGLYDDRTRQPKFVWGAPVSNHPAWPWQAAGGNLFAALVFAAAAITARRRKGQRIGRGFWAAVTAIAIIGGISIGLAAEDVLIEAFGVGGWLHTLALLATAACVPIATAAALGASTGVPAFAEVLGPRAGPMVSGLARVNGALLIVAFVLTTQVALGLVFDPRYCDFPDAALTAAIVPYAIAGLTRGRSIGTRYAAETLAAVLLVLCATYIVFNEGFANWQSLWFCGCLLVLAFTLQRVRDGRS